MSTLKEKLKEHFISNGEFEVHSMDEIKDWPEVNAGGDIEPLDTENYEFLSLTDDIFKMAAGGDWQEPMIVEIQLVDGELAVTDSQAGEFPEGMTEEKFIELLN